MCVSSRPTKSARAFPSDREPSSFCVGPNFPRCLRSCQRESCISPSWGPGMSRESEGGKDSTLANSCAKTDHRKSSQKSVDSWNAGKSRHNGAEHSTLTQHTQAPSTTCRCDANNQNWCNTPFCPYNYTTNKGRPTTKEKKTPIPTGTLLLPMTFINVSRLQRVSAEKQRSCNRGDRGVQTRYSRSSRVLSTQRSSHTHNHPA